MQYTAALNVALGAANGDIGNQIFDFSDHSGCHTSKKGHPLGVARQVWMEVLESEMRIAWMTKMVRKGLCVRDLETFAKAEHGKMRSENLKLKEDERQINS